MNVKEESEKASFKFNIQKTKIMAYSPITSWQIKGEKSRSSDRFYFLGLQNQVWMMTAAMKLKVPCSWEGKL